MSFGELIDAVRVGVELVRAVVWPTTLLVLAYLFRRQINDAARRLTAIKGPGFEATLSDFPLPAVSALTRIEEQATPPIAPTSTPLLELAEKSPGVAISMAWSRVANEAVAAAMRSGLALSAGQLEFTNEAIEGTLQDKSVLSPAAATLLRKLRQVHHSAVNGEIGTNAAMAAQFIGLSTPLEESLRAWQPRAAEK